LRFVVDAQLPPTLARILAAAGHDAEHVIDVGLRDADDASIWNYALEQHAVLLTKDEDFSARSLRSEGPIVVWLRIGNASSRALSDWFTPLLPEILKSIGQGERLIEVR
jgi:predicted nuclease of predicted toxin-antitoxin system